MIAEITKLPELSEEYKIVIHTDEKTLSGIPIIREYSAKNFEELVKELKVDFKCSGFPKS